MSMSVVVGVTLPLRPPPPPRSPPRPPRPLGWTLLSPVTPSSWLLHRSMQATACLRSKSCLKSPAAHTETERSSPAPCLRRWANSWTSPLLICLILSGVSEGNRVFWRVKPGFGLFWAVRFQVCRHWSVDPYSSFPDLSVAFGSAASFDPARPDQFKPCPPRIRGDFELNRRATWSSGKTDVSSLSVFRACWKEVLPHASAVGFQDSCGLQPWIGSITPCLSDCGNLR